MTKLLPWALSSLVASLAFIVWGSSYDWNLGHLSSYQLFPLFGLTAYSLMWSTYMSGWLKKTLVKTLSLKDYFRIVGYFVLVLIVLHPGLLIYQLFRDGFGLPPGSYMHYVAPSLAWVTLLGTVCLFIFLAYELRRFFGKKPWWKYVGYAGDAAMLGIFYHGLRLGSQLQFGWFRKVWIFYGISLIICLAYTYNRRLKFLR